MASRGNQQNERGVGRTFSKEDQRSESKIVRQLKGITIPAPSQPEPERGQPDLRARQLRDGGGEIELEQPEFKRLVEYIETMQWSGAITDDIADFLDSLEVESVKVDERKKDED